MRSCPTPLTIRLDVDGISRRSHPVFIPYSLLCVRMYMSERLSRRRTDDIPGFGIDWDENRILFIIKAKPLFGFSPFDHNFREKSRAHK